MLQTMFDRALERVRKDFLGQTILLSYLGLRDSFATTWQVSWLSLNDPKASEANSAQLYEMA
jgi:hypothetical protein